MGISTSLERMGASTRHNAVEVPTRMLADLIPYVHVADLERSIAFYRKLGLEVESTFETAETIVWAHLRSGAAQIMLARSGEPIDHRQQAILFYLWTPDVAATRQELVGHGLKIGPITYQDHVPAGEIRITDPDGYVLLIGQPNEAN